MLPFNITKEAVRGDPNYTAPTLPTLPFTKYADNPILSPNPANNWDSAYLYDPTAVVLNETIFLRSERLKDIEYRPHLVNRRIQLYMPQQSPSYMLQKTTRP